MSVAPSYPPNPQGNARGHKTRNPGYRHGNYWFLCDRCGCVIRAGEGRMTWDGLFVCPDDWEIRHEQDFVRVRRDQIVPEGPIRPEGDGDLFIESFCPTNTCINGIAIAGCAIAGNTLRVAYTSSVPEPTFGPENL